MNAYFTAMRRYFDFSGRSTRTEYWLFTLVLFILSIIAAVIDGVATGQPGPVAGLVTLVHLIPGLAVSVRRLHDINRSGWWLLIGIVPLVGLIVLLVFACTASTPGNNRFGNDHGVAPDRVQPPSMPQSRVGGTPNPAHIEQLEKLASLLASGAIDQTEFQRLKANLLARPNG